VHFVGFSIKMGIQGGACFSLGKMVFYPRKRDLFGKMRESEGGNVCGGEF